MTPKALIDFGPLPSDLFALWKREQCTIPANKLLVAFQRQGNFTVCLLATARNDGHVGLRTTGASKCDLRYDELDEARGQARAFGMACRNLRGIKPATRCGICDGKHYAKGLCRYHYDKMRRSKKSS